MVHSELVPLFGPAGATLGTTAVCDGFFPAGRKYLGMCRNFDFRTIANKSTKMKLRT